MRDIIITLAIFSSIPFIFKKPYIGILVWSWISYMNPHKLTWGFAFSMPFAQIIAIVLLISLFLSKEEKGKIPSNSITIIWILFIVWMGITTIFSFFPDLAWVDYKRVLKIQLISFLTIKLVTNIKDLRYLIWVIVLSFGFFSVKGGIYTILTGGGGRVWGPPGGFVEDNNALAVAIIMIIPLMVYLYKTSSKKLITKSLKFMIFLSFFTVLGSQSRGAFLAVFVVAIFYWFKTSTKILTGLIFVMSSLVLLRFMPESWHERMETIKNYEQDSSAMGRLNAWQYSINVANDNLLGVGFNSWSLETFAIYAPNPTDVHAAHSIYFSVLADHGWIGLFFFSVIFYLTWKFLARFYKETKDHPELREINILCSMLQVSLIAYLSGGAFLSLSYFDLPWHIVSFVIIIGQLLMKQKAIDQKNLIGMHD